MGLKLLIESSSVFIVGKNCYNKLFCWPVDLVVCTINKLHSMAPHNAVCQWQLCWWLLISYFMKLRTLSAHGCVVMAAVGNGRISVRSTVWKWLHHLRVGFCHTCTQLLTGVFHYTSLHLQPSICSCKYCSELTAVTCKLLLTVTLH